MVGGKLQLSATTASQLKPRVNYKPVFEGIMRGSSSAIPERLAKPLEALIQSARSRGVEREVNEILQTYANEIKNDIVLLTIARLSKMIEKSTPQELKTRLDLTSKLMRLVPPEMADTVPELVVGISEMTGIAKSAEENFHCEPDRLLGVFGKIISAGYTISKASGKGPCPEEMKAAIKTEYESGKLDGIVAQARMDTYERTEVQVSPLQNGSLFGSFEVGSVDRLDSGAQILQVIGQEAERAPKLDPVSQKIPEHVAEERKEKNEKERTHRERKRKLRLIPERRRAEKDNSAGMISNSHKPRVISPKAVPRIIRSRSTAPINKAITPIPPVARTEKIKGKSRPIQRTPTKNIITKKQIPQLPPAVMTLRLFSHRLNSPKPLAEALPPTYNENAKKERKTPKTNNNERSSSRERRGKNRKQLKMIDKPRQVIQQKKKPVKIAKFKMKIEGIIKSIKKKLEKTVKKPRKSRSLSTHREKKKKSIKPELTKPEKKKRPYLLKAKDLKNKERKKPKSPEPSKPKLAKTNPKTKAHRFKVAKPKKKENLVGLEIKKPKRKINLLAPTPQQATGYSRFARGAHPQIRVESFDLRPCPDS